MRPVAEVPDAKATAAMHVAAVKCSTATPIAMLMCRNAAHTSTQESPRTPTDYSRRERPHPLLSPRATHFRPFELEAPRATNGLTSTLALEFERDDPALARSRDARCVHADRTSQFGAAGV